MKNSLAKSISLICLFAISATPSIAGPSPKSTNNTGRDANNYEIVLTGICFIQLDPPVVCKFPKAQPNPAGPGWGGSYEDPTDFTTWTYRSKTPLKNGESLSFPGFSEVLTKIEPTLHITDSYWTFDSTNIGTSKYSSASGLWSGEKSINEFKAIDVYLVPNKGIPEPSMWIFMAIGFGSLGLVVRSKVVKLQKV